jgi:4-hydroxybenzoate polyprenyltransferase
LKQSLDLEEKEGALRSLHYLRLARLQHVLMGAMTTWLVVTMSDGSTTARFFSPLAIGLDILGASLFYFAAANKMYILKDRSYALYKKQRVVVTALGLMAMLGAIVVATCCLSRLCVCLTIFNALVILYYKDFVSKRWWSKNPMIAMVCVTPILIGWAAGENTHPSVPSAAILAFFAYLVREIIKDIQDQRVDRHLRLTLPLVFGPTLARWTAGFLLLLGLYFWLLLAASVPTGQYHVFVPLLIGLSYFGRVTYSLLLSKAGQEAKESKQILIGNVCLILAFFLLVV